MKKVNQAVWFFLGSVLTISAIAAEHDAEITNVNAYKAPYGSHYIVAVTIKSSDKDCSHYVDWWEALSEKGELLYRRILVHPHSKEQPFTRGASIKSINENTVIYIRAHMQPFGYSIKAMKGTLKSGFQPLKLPDGFAGKLDKQGVTPSFCNPKLDRAR